MIIYGLETCPLCQRAKKTLEDNGKSISFRDIRSDPLNDVELNELINEFGDRLVDRKSNDYRSLNVWLKNSEVDAQISHVLHSKMPCHLKFLRSDPNCGIQ